MTTLRGFFWHRPTTRGLFGTRGAVQSSWSRRSFSNGIVQENDRVVLKRTHHLESTPILTPPLVPRKWVDLRVDQIFHNHIIGKRLRDVVRSKKGKEYRITEPTLGEYISLVPRLVTPIYPQDAALIVSLLDLNPTQTERSLFPAYQDAYRDDLNRKEFEIFEAGTGHGALTLHLARAIHAANPRAPELPGDETIRPEQDEKHTRDYDELYRVSYREWRAKHRRAVVHTLDINPTYSRHAKQVIRDYREGMYFPNIEFHIGTVQEYISSRLEESDSQPFFSHAILDMPDCHLQMEIVSKALKPGGTLLVFCPSITQINACALDVKKQRIPLFLENVIELGAAVGVGGREWDVRPVKTRKWLKARAEAAANKQAEKAETVESEEAVNSDEGTVEAETPLSVDEGAAEAEDLMPTTDELADDGWELICRPKVGQRIVGGGFVGVWKRMYMD